MEKATHLFISRECMTDLEVIGEDFPVVGSAVTVGQVFQLGPAPRGPRSRSWWRGGIRRRGVSRQT
jgi:hypothetical protein